jgi:hypothetical protein
VVTDYSASDGNHDRDGRKGASGIKFTTWQMSPYSPSRRMPTTLFNTLLYCLVMAMET